MVIEFVKGQADCFVATRDFALNFDNPRDIHSVKIKEGQIVLYDGINATYEKDGAPVTGRCSSLKSAINNAKWLVPKEPPADTTDAFSSGLREVDDKGNELSGREAIEKLKAKTDFDSLKGGSFDTYASSGREDVYVANIPGKEKIKVIREQDLIVKEIPSIKKASTKKKTTDLEVAGDQVAVKEVGSTLVNSSTSSIRQQNKRSMPIIQADEMGSEKTIPLNISSKKTEDTKKRSSYTVDNTTPRTISEDMTLNEVQKITKIVNADESQDAQVVGKIKKTPAVKEMEGVVLRKTESPSEMSLKHVKSPKEMTITTKVSSGKSSVQEEIVDEASQEEIVDEASQEEIIDEVSQEEIAEDEITQEIIDSMTSQAASRAEQRKKSATQTQKKMENEKVKTGKKTKKRRVLSRSKVESMPVERADDYLLMLPDDWGKLHWVKKEKFINELDDEGFIKFILSVETVDAVKKACVERLKNVGQKSD